MRAARTDDSRRVDWSKVKGDPLVALEFQVIRFVGGIRGTRKEPVTKSQILRWFHGTPPEFVQAAITSACLNDKILVSPRNLSSSRRFNGAYVYIPYDEPL